jgi:uncharacterized repeat protein (TIGR01451 family)
MGTKTSSGRRRAERRGVAAFVSFLLLFAFALGQGSSLTAFAVDESQAPVAPADDGSAGTSTETAADAPAADASTADGSTTDAAADPVASDPATAPDAETVAAPAAPAPEATSTPTQTITGATRPHRAVSAPATTRTIGELTTPRTGGALAAPSASLSGGDIGLDFVAAGPFTYNHVSGVGGAYNNRTISKNNGVVESLEGGDFKCGDLVVFFTQVVVDGSAGGSGAVDIDLSFGAETTGQPGIGFDDIVSVGLNSPDSGNSGLDGNESVTLISETPDPPGDQQGYDQVLGTVRVTNLDPGEHLIVRLVVHLGCLVGSNPTGNIQSAIESASVVGDGKVNVGQETVPFKKVEDIAQPGMDVNKTCPETAAVGDQITYTIEIVNTGNEALNLQSVIDTVNGHAGVNITASFPASVAANSSVSRTYQYTVLANDPDPLPNSVAVVAKGAISQATLNGSASCQTDITHQPGISVTKTCPESVPFGDDVTFTITIENTGNEPLDDVVVTDALLGGDITADFNLPDPLPVGNTEYSAQFTYTPGADEDPVENSVHVEGVGADSGVSAEDDASCDTDVLAPAIQIVKGGPALVHRGDTITYTFEVTNPGETELFDVVLSDPICDPGTITPGADVDGSLAVGEVWHFSCTHLVTGSDPDPIPNTATVRGDTHEGEGGQEVTDTDDHVVDIIHPGIAVVKTVSRDTVPVGTTVTYTYVVTNIGDTTLYDVSVDDDILGHIGDIAILEPGASVTLTKDFVVGDEPVTNVATVSGNDILGRSVSALDEASVAPIAGSTPTPPPTPFTGSEAGRLGLISIVLFGIGVTVVAATRRRRAGRDAA